jgi:hypothetical protein
VRSFIFFLGDFTKKSFAKWVQKHKGYIWNARTWEHARAHNSWEHMWKFVGGGSIQSNVQSRHTIWFKIELQLMLVLIIKWYFVLLQQLRLIQARVCYLLEISLIVPFCWRQTAIISLTTSCSLNWIQEWWILNQFKFNWYMLWCRYIVNWLIIGQYLVKMSRKLHCNLIKNRE